MGLEEAKEVLNLQLDWNRSADARVPILFAICSAIIGSGVAFLKPTSEWSNLYLIVIALFFIFIFTSVVFLAMIIWPRTASTTKSNIYFGEISSLNRNTYIENFKSTSPEEHLEDILSQIHINASIAKTKYEGLGTSYISTIMALPFWLLIIIFNFEVFSAPIG